MNDSTKLLPKLRFPEFQGDPIWEEKEVGQIFEVTRGEVLSMTLVSDFQTDRKFYPVYSSQTKHGGLAGYYSEYLYEDAITWTTDGANAGEVNYRSGKFYCTNVCGVLINTEGYANLFVATLLNTLTRRHVSYVGNPKLMNGVMSKISLPLPDLQEQKKIADCLASIDDLIGAEAEKLTELKRYKKGLLQQLFADKGQSLPARRFPEFKDLSDWTSVTMGTLLNRTPEYGVNAPAVPYSTKLPRYLRITDISEDGRYLPEKRVSVDLNAKEENYLKEHDIALARTGASVGKSYRYRETDGKLVFAGFLIRIEPNPQKVVSAFLANFLTSDQFWNWVATTSARSGQPGINSNEYSSLSIPLPPKLKEQQKIADCLTRFDDLIETQTQKIEILKAHRKGLMQQLFPSLNEVVA